MTSSLLVRRRRGGAAGVAEREASGRCGLRRDAGLVKCSSSQDRGRAACCGGLVARRRAGLAAAAAGGGEGVGGFGEEKPGLGIFGKQLGI